MEKGFVTILSGPYPFQDCFHLLTSLRKFHSEPVVVVTAGLPKTLEALLRCFDNVHFKPVSFRENPVLTSRLAKTELYELSPFKQTIYLDCDICLLDNVDDLFALFDSWDLLLVKDPHSTFATAKHLLRRSDDVLNTLRCVGLPLSTGSVQYNGGMIGFSRSDENEQFFLHFKRYFQIVLRNQHLLKVRDQGALAAAVEKVKPRLNVLPYSYNFLSRYGEKYDCRPDMPVKIVHCTYAKRPDYAREVTRGVAGALIDGLTSLLSLSSYRNPWRTN